MMALLPYLIIQNKLQYCTQLLLVSSNSWKEPGLAKKEKLAVWSGHWKVLCIVHSTGMAKRDAEAKRAEKAFFFFLLKTTNHNQAAASEAEGNYVQSSKYHHKTIQYHWTACSLKGNSPKSAQHCFGVSRNGLLCYKLSLLGCWTDTSFCSTTHDWAMQTQFAIATNPMAFWLHVGWQSIYFRAGQL